ncbi:hypothetical protein EIN_250360 [Entamoeba invadens IP1]|uniref:Uncharacterized protein n=1 Tax=Entamoeba invadens IP1 TaxID=370355 RepID=A0A0A1UH97_ENTIV|nr:hypothetical protein EIN_250360 [Entamoeba invadens IP1]ELP94942.1 hypothetical protein EIN_250360 [Entamoeba invadens IP1]|eukprot:XP_004261713.1 hypothetical protein EIN_250360 [Entamoeba invadens IP1]
MKERCVEVQRLYPERSEQILAISNSIRYGRYETVVVERQIEDDALIILSACFKDLYPYLLVQKMESLFAVGQNAFDKVIETREHFMNKHNERPSHFILVVNDIEDPTNTLYLQRILELQDEYKMVYSDSFDLFLTTYSSIPTLSIPSRESIKFPYLSYTALETIISSITHNSPNVAQYTQEFISLAKDLHNNYATRTTIQTDIFSLFNTLNSSNDTQEVTQLIIQKMRNDFMRPILCGKNVLVETTDIANDTSYYLNYLLYSAFLISLGNDGKRTAKPLKISTVYMEFAKQCPNPLSFCSFVFVFRTALDKNYFIPANYKETFLCNSYKINISRQRFDQIAENLFGNRNGESDAL